MNKAILFAGFGGQGIMLMGRLMAYGAIYEGLEVTFYPSYGPEMRGGTANCTVTISDQRIGSPVKSSYACLMAMNQPSLDKFASSVKPGGILAYNAHLQAPQQSDCVSWPIAATALAGEMGSVQIANMLALGGLLPAVEVVSLEAIIQGLSRVIPAHRRNMLELNQSALEKGYESVSE